MRPIVTLGAVLAVAHALTAERSFREPIPQPRPTVATQTGREPDAVLSLEESWAGADALMPLTASADPVIQRFALRAVGRLEDPHLVAQLLKLAQVSAAAGPALADAIAQSLKGFDPQNDPALVESAYAWLRTRASVGDPSAAAPYLIPLGRIPAATPEQVHQVEDILRSVMERSENGRLGASAYQSAARAMEVLARVNGKTTRFDSETSTRLSRMVANSWVNDGPEVRALALSALIGGGRLGADTEKTALKDEDDEVRRIATTVLAGAGAGVADVERAALFRERLSDRSPFLRYEAVRGYARRASAANGCAPIVDVLGDPDSHVALAAIDALGDACLGDRDITSRLVAELRTPPVSGRWNREAHVFVTLAKRDPQSIEMSMQAFVTHPLWWVRMYAARAAAAAGDVIRLRALSIDANDNVRDAALAPLRRLDKADAEPAIVAALARPDYQLVRDAAMLLKESPRDERLGRPLVDALLRLTRERKETSRDARIPLLEAIEIHGSTKTGDELAPLLRDFDPVVAAKAADVSNRLTGKPVHAEPVRIVRGWPRGFDATNGCVAVALAGGGTFYMKMDPTSAPMTVDRFLTLALTEHYYDGLSFHRVVPNFVVQGGSPGANEYAGHKDYMRDEIAATNERGTVGLSTRGRNTADAQFYINLVPNHRLDYDYTIFARVTKGMDVVDRMEEGAEIRRVELSSRCGS